MSLIYRLSGSANHEALKKFQSGLCDGDKVKKLSIEVIGDYEKAELVAETECNRCKIPLDKRDVAGNHLACYKCGTKYPISAFVVGCLK